ncbi:APC membrane recruitment protein 3 [Nycticebus coucang]|uniref:APC membrane recruitment protein 3 n=1 Tax=Nycticebus coucang TaxID=9470 RepID=UPI00234C8D7E|nr:APC membrane recruitment protein 3 [Nycticebus coucang]XP_053454355.1 APC membrane recruitment protein 3 [Nycticebus coucang]XP_053454356.1 APC membrane recruitment protein 3 [Nycticebus coucang]XP_053454357.1 APC membrane recruitment protein 3 [Nycticebus coucang]XP_053454358.1 APC membrane recruitment protein 3 [Nycticebus coucang]
MELKRGRTFIKSSLQISHEKPADPVVPAPARGDAGPWSVPLGGQQRPHSEKTPQSSLRAQDYDRCSNQGAQPDPEGGPATLCGATFKLLRKSKTHDSVLGAGRAAATTGQLVGSASFLGTSGSQRMIDYRHFAPQTPFVPAVAKSIPRKRISLKRPKKCFRNLFHIRRNKTDNLVALEDKGKSMPSPGGPLDAGRKQGKAFLPLGEGPGPDSLCQDLSDSELLTDSSFDLCGALCEDVASLQSFDSLTGCGEIFADESSVPSLELNEDPESPAGVPQNLDSKVPRAPFQGGIEQLASPAQNEASDFSKFWESVNRSVRQQQRALLGPWPVATQGTDTDQPRLDAARLAELPLCRNPLSGSKASSVDTGTPKSEQPESVSTSDEGYYDSFSPGLEEDRKEATSPGTPAAPFPRDSYSGDALYELFHDPSEVPVGPSPDDDLCVSESLSGPALGTPLSICSFHMGAEENLAPAPGPDLLSQGFLQSSWKGKECLLKLCDTELAITMGIVSWLRRGPGPRAPPAPVEPTVPLGPQKAPRGPAEKLEGRGSQASEAGGPPVCSAPGRQELWARSSAKSLPPRESQVPGSTAQGPGSLEEGTQGRPSGLFSSVGSAAAVTADTPSTNKALSPSTWPSSQKEPRPPGDLGSFQGLWRPAHGGSTLDTEPMLTGCVAHVAALQIHPDGQDPSGWLLRQDAGSELCRQPQARGPGVLPQKQPSSCSTTASAGDLPSPASTLNQRRRDYTLDLSWLRVKSAGLSVQTSASVEDQPPQLSMGAVEQAAHGGQPDSEPHSALAAWHSPRGLLALDNQREGGPSASAPECRCSLLAREGLLYIQPDMGAPRLAMAEPHL